VFLDMASPLHPTGKRFGSGTGITWAAAMSVPEQSLARKASTATGKSTKISTRPDRILASGITSTKLIECD
jgi:hypothetical protein